jgi:hypothetical protein
MTDNFEKSFSEARTKLDKLKSQLGDYDTARKGGLATKKNVYMMKTTNNVLSVNMKHLEKLQYEMDHSGSNFSNLS